MGIKKIARPINKAKNTFVKWLEDNKATSISVFEGEEGGWDYYRMVDGFLGDNLYVATFMIWNGEIKIEYKNEDKNYDKLSIDGFLQLITK